MTQTTEAEPERPASQRSRKFVFGILALIVLFGLALRLWGITWSLPDKRHPIATYHPDEIINLNAAQKADLLSGKLDIEFYNYGTLYFYLVNFSHIFGRGWGLIPTTPPVPEGTTLSDVENLVRTAPENAGLFLAGRLVTALLGAATILALFALGNRAFGDRVGIAAAMLYAVAPLAVVHAHFLTVDVPATFFVTMALLWAIQLLDSKKGKDFILAGVWVGLAAATKYNAGLVFIAPVVATFLNRGEKEEPHKILPNLSLLLGATVGTFLLACPGIWLNWDVFWNGMPNYPGSGVRYELFEHSRSGHGEAFLNTGPGWWYHLIVSLRCGLGFMLFLYVIGGGVGLAIQRVRPNLPLLAFFLLYFGLAGFSAVRFARYMLPLFPVLCLWAGYVCCTYVWPKPTGRRLENLASLLVVLLTLMETHTYLSAMTARDPRDRAADTLEKNAPQGASVGFAKIPWFFSPPLSPFFGAPAAPIRRAQAAANTTRFTLRIPSSEWDSGVLSPLPDYVVVSNLETQHAVERLKIPQAVAWITQVKASYKQETFGSPVPTLLTQLSGNNVPEDLLYVAPTVWVYSLTP
jgi:4-amino-4-deoxy-L-arabinose transferase-like glycosyltransferase